ncbi:hypothetical protein [Chryseobacterium sp.]|uniref:hypothetical protein n=1 Tax=Chryseobacterium sp. TaxID=1871047 RepID=UPI00289E4E3F|nr:hypothetical protein [Chryseobacterium sp.]
MSIPLNTIYSYFETGDFPTQEQFQASWSSFWHKDESIPTTKIAGLDNLIQNKADKAIFETHVSNPDSHANYLAKKDASNLNNENVQSWKTKLGVGDLPNNIATVDAYDESGNISEFGNVYTKGQSNDMFMSYGDYTDDDGNILAEKIEALGITTLVEASETTISAFASNSSAYVFEDNDFIAIPVNGENYSLYMFKGGKKTDKSNYLPTGISNVTIGMVEGLQASLNNKMDKPSGNGSFFIRGLGPGPIYASISPASNYLLQWDGSDFKESNVYNNTGKLGIGTTVPSEQLHLTGKLRSKGVVLDENDEIVKNQITYYNRGFYATDSGSVRKKILMKEDLASEFLQIPDQLSDVNKTDWKTKMNGGWTTGTMSVAAISPPIVDRSDKPSWITLKGANLNLPSGNFKIEICTEDSTALNTTVITEIPASQVQLYTNGVDLSFWFNFSSIPIGKYKIRLWNGVAFYLTGANTMIQVFETITPFTPTLNWEYAEYTPGSGTMVGTNASLSYQSKEANKAYAAYDFAPISVAKSSELFSATDNFYLRIGVNITAISAGMDNANPFSIGLCNTVDALSLNDLSVVKARGTINYRGGGIGLYPDLSGTVVGTWAVFLGEVVIMRNNGLFTIIVTVDNKTSIYTKSAPYIPLSLFAMMSNAPNTTTASFHLLEKYKF